VKTVSWEIAAQAHSDDSVATVNDIFVTPQPKPTVVKTVHPVPRPDTARRDVEIQDVLRGDWKRS
jgi:hypothetical protein